MSSTIRVCGSTSCVKTRKVGPWLLLCLYFNHWLSGDFDVIWKHGSLIMEREKPIVLGALFLWKKVWLILRDMKRVACVCECVCARVCVFILDGERDRIRKQREAWRERCLRAVWLWKTKTWREGGGGSNHCHLGFAPAARPSAHDSPPAPHFLTPLINRSLVWLVTIEPLRGAGFCEDVDGLLVSSTWHQYPSIPPHLHSCTCIKNKKGFLCETEKHRLRCQTLSFDYVVINENMFFSVVTDPISAQCES